jgi:hypothetical protein
VLRGAKYLFYENTFMARLECANEKMLYIFNESSFAPGYLF